MQLRRKQAAAAPNYTAMHQECKRAPWPIAKLAALGASQGGISLCFGLQYALLTPFVLELGVSKRSASLIWLGGPLTGMLVQPLVGRLSDKYTGYWSFIGRRRPFLAMGALICIVAQVLVGNCMDLGHILGDTGPSDNVVATAARENAEFKMFAAIIFVFGFWLLDAGSNMVYVVSRALIVDVVPEEERLLAFSVATLASGMGLAVGYLAGGLPWSHLKWLAPFIVTGVCGDAGGCADLRAAFTIALITCVSSVLCTMVVGQERRLMTPLEKMNSGKKASNISRESGASLPNSPSRSASPPREDSDDMKDDIDLEDVSMISATNGTKKNHSAAGPTIAGVILGDEVILGVYLVTMFAWFGWISVQVYQSHFVAEEIFHGSPDPQSPANALYVEGMKVASMALVANALLMSLATGGFTWARALLGDRGLWVMSTNATALLLASSMLVLAWESRAAAVMWLVLLGPFYGVQCTIPYVILSGRAPEELQGELQGYLNVAVCVPQLLLSLFGGSITIWFGTDVVLFVLGACANAIAAILCWRLLHVTTPACEGEGASKSMDRCKLGKWSCAKCCS